MRPRFRFGGRRSESRRFLRSRIGGMGVPRADSTYAGGRRGKERAARYERSSDWRRGAQRPRPEEVVTKVRSGREVGRYDVPDFLKLRIEGRWEAEPMTTGFAPGNRFGSARATLETTSGSVAYFRLDSLVDAGVV